MGRERELAELDGLLAETQAGRGGLMLLGGEPGIGKTRIADELGRRATGAGFNVRWGRCWEVGGAPGYWPWLQVLRGLLRDTGLEAHRDKLQAALARLVPESPSASGAGGALASGDRFQLFDAVTMALRDATELQPLLVIFDDLHAADPSSLALLEFVARELRGCRVAIVATLRGQEARLGPDQGEAVSRVAREGSYLPLARLDLGEVQLLLEACLPDLATTELAAAVMAATEGHPLFVDEVRRALLARKDSWEGGKLGVPSTVRAAINERVARLDAETRHTLQRAAVLGRDVTLTTLAALLGVEPGALERPIRAAIAAGVLVEIEPGGPAYAHARGREARYAALPGEQRAALHARAAEGLERGGAPEAAQGEIANHLLDAVALVGSDAAFAGAQRAARRALSTFAYEDAAAILVKALARLEPDIPPRALCEALILLGEARVRVFLDGSEACTRAAALARQLDDPELLARAALALGAEISPARVSETLVALLRDALERLPPEPSSLRARALARLAGALQPAPDPREPVALAREAIAQARVLGDPDTLRVVLHGAGAALVDYAPPRERLGINRELLQLAERVGDSPLSFRAQLRLFFDQSEVGAMSDADVALRACADLAAVLRRPRQRWYVAMLRATRAVQSGRFEEASRWQAEAMSEAVVGDSMLDLSLGFHRFARALFEYDDLRLRELVPAFRSFDVAIAGLYEPLVSALVMARTGEPDLARVRVAEVAFDHPALRFDPSGLHMLAEVCLFTELRQKAEFVLDALEPHRGNFVTWGVFGLAVLGPHTGIIARLEALLGRFDAAARDFEAAIAQSAAAGAAPALAELYCEYGRMLLARAAAEPGKDGGRRDKAVKLIERGLALARQIRMPGLVVRAEVLIASAAAPDVRAPVAEATTTAAPLDFSLIREGDVWLITRPLRSFRLKDSRGLQMLAHLVANPGREVHVLALGQGGDPGQLGDAGEAVDAKAMAAYRRRLSDLREMEREAEELADDARLGRVREEIEQLAQQLSQSVGLGGRGRRAASIAERARTNVQRRIKEAIGRIEKGDPELGQYLSWTVRTGTFCAFDPARGTLSRYGSTPPIPNDSSDI